MLALRNSSELKHKIPTLKYHKGVLFTSFHIASDNCSVLYSTPKHFTTSMSGFNKYLIVLTSLISMLSANIQVIKSKCMRAAQQLTCCGNCQQDNQFHPLLPF